MGVVVLSAAVWAAGAASLASAATSTASFGVSATVMASCTVAPRRWTTGPVCLRSRTPTIRPATAPVVSVSRDPQTGALVQTIAF